MMRRWLRWSAGRLHTQATTVRNHPTAGDKLVESAVRIRLLGANQHPQFEASSRCAGRVNYLIGNDPSKYHRDVPIFGRVKERTSIRAWTSCLLRDAGSRLEYDLVAAPGADTSKLKFAVEGGSKTEIDANGNLIVTTPAGLVVLQKPRVYQRDASGNSTPIEGAFAIAGDGTIDAGIVRHEVGFNIAAYDHSRTLTIDPTVNQIVYSTYLGGTGTSTGPFFQREISDFSGGGNILYRVADAATDVAIDQASGDAFVTGIAYSNNFPTSATPFQNHLTGANSPPQQNPNAFVSQFDPSMAGAAALIFSTYLGGSGDNNPADAGQGNGDFGSGIAEDASGNTFIVGQTFSSDFPSTNTCGAFGQSNSQAVSAIGTGFVAKLNNTGATLTYACYIGGALTASESRVALFPAGCGNIPTRMPQRPWSMIFTPAPLAFPGRRRRRRRRRRRYRPHLRDPLWRIRKRQ